MLVRLFKTFCFFLAHILIISIIKNKLTLIVNLIACITAINCSQIHYLIGLAVKCTKAIYLIVTC